MAVKIFAIGRSGRETLEYLASLEDIELWKSLFEITRGGLLLQDSSNNLIEKIILLALEGLELSLNGEFN